MSKHVYTYMCVCFDTVTITLTGKFKMITFYHFQICTFLQGATVQLIEDQKVPYAIKQNEWAGYDNKESFNTKVLVYFYERVLTKNA